MLSRQDLCGGHERGLLTCFDSGQHGEQSHHCLATADVPLQQAQHPVGRSHVRLDFRQCRLLRGGERKGEGGQGSLDKSPIPS